MVEGLPGRVGMALADIREAYRIIPRGIWTTRQTKPTDNEIHGISPSSEPTNFPFNRGEILRYPTGEMVLPLDNSQPSGWEFFFWGHLSG
jgi:hypothetical protein